MSSELLNFEISLSGTYWDKQPEFSVWLDDELITRSNTKPDNSIIKFDRDLLEGDHVLKIRLENKTTDDTVLENGLVVKDMLLNINNIKINNINLGDLLWSANYYLDQPQEYQGKTITQLDNCVNLGWNGSYSFNFKSPFTIWLLEKL